MSNSSGTPFSGGPNSRGQSQRPIHHLDSDTQATDSQAIESRATDSRSKSNSKIVSLSDSTDSGLDPVENSPLDDSPDHSLDHSLHLPATGTLPALENNVAVVLPFTRDCAYHSSIEIDDLHDIQMQYTENAVEKVIIEVGFLLRKEFGHALVRRQSQRFCVYHNDFEQLVAGILRVQFYSNRIELPETNVFAEKTEQNGITLTWGVGHDDQQAAVDRNKKKRQKQQRQQLRRKRHRSLNRP